METAMANIPRSKNESTFEGTTTTAIGVIATTVLTVAFAKLAINNIRAILKSPEQEALPQQPDLTASLEAPTEGV